MALGHIPKKDSEGNPIYRSQNVALDDYLRVRHVGIFNTTITANTSVDIDWEVPQLSYFGANKPSMMTGVIYKVTDGNPGDHIDFCIVDTNNVLGYGAGAVLDQFGDNYYAFPGSVCEIREHKATLVTGLFIRAHYTSAGANDSKFVCNLLRYMDTK